ncbi:MAG: S1C family serine protease [Bacillota bacterium]
MPKSMKRILTLLLTTLLTLTLAASAAAETQPVTTAPATEPSPLEQRLEALEKRLAELERLLALTTIDIPALVAKSQPAVVSLYLVTDQDRVIAEGTGFLWSKDGTILTNAHVVQDEELRVKAKFADGRVLDAERVLVDSFLDLAILDVEGTDHPFLTFAKEKPAVGAPVVVIGNAAGYSHSVSFGIVSGVDRPSPYHAIVHYPSLQTDAAINHGNSGGPILNAAGEVVAIATWTEGKGETDSIAFGIPVDQVMAALAKRDPKKGIVRPWFGISVQEPYWARGGLPNDLGLMITDLHPSSFAAKVGLKPEDYIMKVNGVPVNYLMDLRRELEKTKPGQTVTFTVERLVGEKWVPMNFRVVAGEYSAVTAPLIPTLRYDPETDDIF